MNPVRPSARVQQALADNGPIVALESTIFSELGLPAPANEEALERCFAPERLLRHVDTIYERVFES